MRRVATIGGSRRFLHQGPFRLTIAAIMTALMTGCSVGPDYQAPTLALPAQWGQQQSPVSLKPAALSDWWRQLDDPVLNSLIAEAIAGNLDVSAALARIREARANRRQVTASLFPDLNGMGTATRQSSAAATMQGGGPSAGSSISNAFQAGFDASWELDLFGGNRRSLEAATYGEAAAEEQLHSTMLTLIGDVAANYVEARGAQARLALSRHTAISQRSTAGLTEMKFKAGSASAVDVERALAQASSTEADIPTTETAYLGAVHRLSLLIGREPGAVLPRMRTESGRIPAPKRPLPAGIPMDVLSRRPDVRLAERQLAQATAQIGIAQAALYPSVSLSGNLTTSASTLADFGKASTIGWSFGPSLNVPIFSGGALEAGVDATKARRDQASIVLKSTVLGALQDVENAIVSLTNERRRAERLAESAAHAREAARLSRTLYETGTSSFLDVLDAERSHYMAEDAVLQSRIASATDYISLAKALGGGWDKPVAADRGAIVDTNTGPHLATEPARFADRFVAISSEGALP